MQRVTRSIGRGWRRVSLTRVGLLLGLFVGGAGSASAQAPVVISTYDKVGTTEQLAKQRPLTQVLGLRPNVTEAVYLYARAGAEGGGPYTAKILWINPEGGTQEAASAAVPALAANETRVITGWTISGTSPPAVATAPAPGVATPPAVAPAVKGPPGLELTGLSPVVEVRLIPTKAGTREKPISQSFRLRVERPTDYLTIKATESAGTANVVEVKIQATADFHGPACRVELGLSGLRGADPKAVRGVFKGKVAKPGESAVLLADVGFPQAASRAGDISVTADGWTQAQLFHVDFSQATAQAADLQPVADAQLSVATSLPLCDTQAGLMYCSRPVDALPIELQVYTPESRAGSVIAWFDFKGKVGEKVTRQGTREQHVYVLPPKADGALLLQTEVHDWVLKLDTPGTTGILQLNAELYLNEGERAALARDYHRNVLFTDAPPTDIRLAAVMPTERIDGQAVPVLIRGKPLVLRASARDESGIAKAMFFLGKVGDDNKLPAVAVPGKLRKGKDGPFWEAALPLPEKLVPGPLDVGVLFTDNVGLSGKEATVVILKEPVPLDTTIEGDVRVGDLLQPDLTVELRDDKNGVKATTKTKADGHYRFTHVVPGAYRVFAEKLGGAHDEQAVEVQKGDQKKGVDLTLLR